MVRKCNNCGKEIQDNRNFPGHVQRCVHNRTKTLSCDRCGKRYSYRSSMYLHKRTCSGRPPSNQIIVDDCVYNIKCVSQNDKHFENIKINTRPTRVSRVEPYKTKRQTQKVDTNKHKYVMCLRTKTCSLIKNGDEAEGEDGDETIEFTAQDIEDDTNDHEFEGEEYEIEEVVIPDEIESELTSKSNQEQQTEDNVVILEDYGYFNKVEVRKSAPVTVKSEDENDCDGIEEFIDFKSYPYSRKNYQTQ